MYVIPFYERKPIIAGALQQNLPTLQHIVLIKYKLETSNKILYDIENAANALAQIPGVYELTYGNNVSPEGFDQGFGQGFGESFERRLWRRQRRRQRRRLRVSWKRAIC